MTNIGSGSGAGLFSTPEGSAQMLQLRGPRREASFLEAAHPAVVGPWLQRLQGAYLMDFGKGGPNWFPALPPSQR